MKQSFPLLFFFLIACKQEVSMGINFKALQAALGKANILSKAESNWLSKVPDNKLSKDSTLSILKEAFLQDFPLEFRPVISSSSSDMRGLADRTAAYPNQQGSMFITIDDPELDSLIKVNKKLIDVLAQQALISKPAGDSLKKIVEKREVIFKYDVVDGVSKIK